MRSLETLTPKRLSARRALLTGLCLLAVGCTQSEGGGPSAPTPSPAGSMQERAAAATPSASRPLRDDLATFAQNLGRKLDRSRGPTSVALPEGGFLNIPNGHVAHASVMVRGPDGKLHTACVSSPAEVNALVERVQTGAGR